MKKHYHLLYGQPGCMPDTNDIYETERAGLDALAQFKKELENDLNITMEGSMKMREFITDNGMILELIGCNDIWCEVEQ